uniref:Uncharacterized protein n=1 Tax=Arundo donax TaxID=35708 RepID=A0A0A8XTV3_ARUDO
MRNPYFPTLHYYDSISCTAGHSQLSHRKTCAACTCDEQNTTEQHDLLSVARVPNKAVCFYITLSTWYIRDPSIHVVPRQSV